MFPVRILRVRVVRWYIIHQNVDKFIADLCVSTYGQGERSTRGNLREGGSECKTVREDMMEPLKTEFQLSLQLQPIRDERCLRNDGFDQRYQVAVFFRERGSLLIHLSTTIIDCLRCACSGLLGVCSLWANILIRPTTRCASWPRRRSSVIVTKEQIPYSFCLGDDGRHHDAATVGNFGICIITNALWCTRVAETFIVKF